MKGVGGRSVVEQVRSGEAGVALAPLGVEDPELGPPPRRAEAVAGDHHLRPLTDHVSAEPYPGPSGELEAQARRADQSLADGSGQAGRLEHEEAGLRPSGERGEPAQALGQVHRPLPFARWPGRYPAGGQVQQEQVHRAVLEERGGHRQGLAERARHEDDEPLEANAARHRLDRVQAPGEVQIGDDPAAPLDRRGKPEGERRLAARCLAVESGGGGPGQAARPEDRVERGEAGRDDLAEVGRAGPGQAPAGAGGRLDGGLTDRLGQRQRRRPGNQGERADDVHRGSGRYLAPALPEGGQSRGDCGGGARHGTTSIERMF